MHRFNKLTIGVAVTAVVLTAGGWYTMNMHKTPKEPTKQYQVEGQGTQTIYYPDGTKTVVPTTASPTTVTPVEVTPDAATTPAPESPATTSEGPTPYQQWQATHQRPVPKSVQGTYNSTSTE